MNQDFIEGAQALMHAAVACVMKQAGLTVVHISREQLAAALSNLDEMKVRQGVATGMTFHLVKRITPTERASLENATTPEPPTGPGRALTTNERWCKYCQKIINGQYCHGCAKATVESVKPDPCHPAIECCGKSPCTFGLPPVKPVEDVAPENRKDCPTCDGEGVISKGARGHRKIECRDCHGCGTVLNWD